MTDIDKVADFAGPISSWMHLIGAGVFLYLILRRLHTLDESPSRFAAIIAFGVATVLQLTVSGLYHLLGPSNAYRPLLQQLDHAAIFVLIATTLTALHVILFTGAWSRRLIVVVWLMCLVGISLKTIFFKETPEWLGLSFYFGMGLLGLITTIALWKQYGAAFALPVLAGGMIYTAGALMDFLRKPVLIPGVFGPHECLHAAVLIALALHWWFILRVLQLQAQGDCGHTHTLASLIRSPDDGRLTEGLTSPVPLTRS